MPMSAADKIAQYAHLLGQVPDREIAEKSGVSRSTVSMLRRRQGIAACSQAKAVPEAIAPSSAFPATLPPVSPTPTADVLPNLVAIATAAPDPDNDPQTLLVNLLNNALDASGFWPCIAASAAAAAVPPDALRVLIAPDFAFFDKNSPTATDPALVEALIDLLHERGYTQVEVGATPNSPDQWLDNRDVLVIADMVGYRFITDAGHAYDVVDLSEDGVPVPFPAGSALHGSELGRPWVEAQFRINVAKNKTHEEYFYGLCLHNLLGVLPLRDKHYHYRVRLKPWDVCLDVLQQTPPHFNLIDATVSNHGSAGCRMPRPIETRTIIAGCHTLLTDWAGAVKMDLDPYASPLNAKALTELGLPEPHRIVGDLTPYPDWENVYPLWADLVRRMNDSAELSRVMQLATLRVNRELFPFKGEGGDRLNAMLSPLFANMDRNPAAFWAALGLNSSGAATAQSLEMWRTLFFKKQLRWQEVPLDLSLDAFHPADYEAVIGYIEPLEDLIQDTPADKHGLRWRYLDGSVLFKFARVIDAPFEEFCQRVDISRSIQFMKDYMGGCCVPIAWDDQGRVIHQAERNLYLPQPNYLVVYGGKMIDVAKLEYIRYEPQQQKIFWRTVKSSNDSAEFDDGSVTFARVGDRQTLVTIMARQRFTLPLFWQAVNLDLNPPVKDYLVSDTYYTYFSDTLNNFEAKYEGREFRIGQPWNPARGQPDAETEASLLPDFAAQALEKADQLARQFTAGDWLQRVQTRPTPTATPTAQVDADGFSHFQSPPPRQPADPSATGRQVADTLKSFGSIAGEFLVDLGNAIRKDMGLGRHE